MEVIIEKLIYERAPWIFSKNIFIKALKPLIYKILNYEKTLNIANNIKDLNCDKLFNYLCDLLAKNVKITGLSNIPKTGSAIIICNHPTGIADGIMIYHSINKIRPDLFFYANVDAIRIFPQLSNMIAPIQWRARKRTLTSSRETLKFTKEAFKNQRLAIIFPSGLIPTLILATPLFNCLMIISEPIKSPLGILSLEIAHFKFASTGVLPLSNS